MSEPVVDLSDWWPLVPPDNYTPAPDWVKKLLYLHVMPVLPSLDFGPTHKSQFKFYLTGVSSLAVSWSVDIAGEEWPYEPIPAAIGNSTAAMSSVVTGAVFSSDPGTVSGVHYEIHPDCIDMLAAAPTLILQERDDVEKKDGLPDPEHAGQRQNGQETPGASSGVLTIVLQDGYNVGVSMVDDTIVWNGTARAGAGPWTETPYIDVVSLSDAPGRGLRSVNGASGAITIDGGDDVGVSVTVDTTQPTGNIVQVTLTPKV